MARNFERVNGSHGLQKWIKKTDRTVFVSHYPSVPGRQSFFYVYRSVNAPPAGRMPWTVDNRRICSPRHAEGRFHRLPDALAFAEAA